MKETRQVTLLKCDKCGRTQQDDGLMRIGTPALSGWFHLSKTEVKDRADSFGATKDFCSHNCLLEYLLAETLVQPDELKTMGKISEEGVIS